MKPKKFLQKRSKPDGGGMKNDSGAEIRNYFHLKKNNLSNLLQKKFSEEYRSVLNASFRKERKRNLTVNIISIFISLLLLISTFLFHALKMGWF
ncbi:MAG TPA: hypothetical protein VKA10_04425 [Prolixibacteraceae bacterium]|nr:hypothetical protein [Prolixibacteraceae bacterium]